jgi:hypothetical protein
MIHISFPILLLLDFKIKIKLNPIFHLPTFLLVSNVLLRPKINKRACILNRPAILPSEPSEEFMWRGGHVGGMLPLTLLQYYKK